MPPLRSPDQKQDLEVFSFEFATERITVSRHAAYTEILCSVNEGGIVKNHHWRMIEAIEFAFGCSIYPAGKETQESRQKMKAILSVVPGTEKEGMLPSPTPLGIISSRNSVIDVVKRYYEYVRSCVEEEHPPPVALALSSMRAAANAQPEAKALAFSVASETLIAACYPEYTRNESGLEKEIDAFAKKIREDTAVFRSLREQAASIVSGIKEPSNSRGLKTFIYTQASNRDVAKEIFEDWRKLRNPSTHGKRADPDTFHRINSRTNVVLDLCYSIVLARIGYLGTRFIYGQTAGNPWNLSTKKQMPIPSKRTDNDVLKIIRRRQWVQVGDMWSKKVPIAEEYSIELAVRTFVKGKGSNWFKIEVSPDAVLADMWSCMMVRAEFPACSEAQDVCEEIAKRALLHIDLGRL
jgi:hypothetical protein